MAVLELLRASRDRGHARRAFRGACSHAAQALLAHLRVGDHAQVGPARYQVAQVTWPLHDPAAAAGVQPGPTAAALLRDTYVLRDVRGGQPTGGRALTKPWFAHAAGTTPGEYPLRSYAPHHPPGRSAVGGRWVQQVVGPPPAPPTIVLAVKGGLLQLTGSGRCQAACVSLAVTDASGRTGPVMVDLKQLQANLAQLPAGRLHLHADHVHLTIHIGQVTDTLTRVHRDLPAPSCGTKRRDGDRGAVC